MRRRRITAIPGIGVLDAQVADPALPRVQSPARPLDSDCMRLTVIRLNSFVKVRRDKLEALFSMR